MEPGPVLPNIDAIAGLPQEFIAPVLRAPNNISIGIGKRAKFGIRPPE